MVPDNNTTTANHVEPEGVCVLRKWEKKDCTANASTAGLLQLVRHAFYSKNENVDSMLWMHKGTDIALEAYGGVETGQHLLQSAPLILEI